ncbi:hypothetical protein SHKM778_80480 [Streptomyces sp. KM77-8]|uniref:Uncharacterized protein n=1 Tax=Streptomyces haneummycinicus TaxID=3074435 RepID=A0AAT9HWK4_9ACTN
MRLCGIAVTNTPALSRASRVRGPSVTPGAQPLPSRRRASFTGHNACLITSALPAPLTAAPAVAVARGEVPP